MRHRGVTFIASTSGCHKTAGAITCSEAGLGIETGNKVIPGLEYAFADYPFSREDHSFEDHLETVKELRPERAVAPDVDENRDLDEVIEKARELKKYADEVIIVPKTCDPADIPDEFIVGYPNAPDFSGAEVDVEKFRRASRVHILGGSPRRAREVAYYLKNVVSYDSNSCIKASLRGGKVWHSFDKGWVERPDLDAYERMVRSLNNIEEAFSGLNPNRQKSLNAAYY